ncbi:hypothetical protein CEK62_08970 [Alcanivorax sp. N3-2A]|nr:hypothetical protein CEK62_08970 [Alcanivorax sp. N3-2A]|tara:strand:+ start:17746 stop:18561 length:816 start_codon:yes stop_codon:yes gene_type:complete
MNDPAALAGELRWLLAAPALLNTPAGVDDGGPWLALASAAQPGLIETAARALARQPRPRRLGVHFENLVAALIEHSERFELVARNLPLRNGGQTLGELDMLVRDRASGELAHWELALKFYLGLADHGAWPGPNPADQLADKARHLQRYQLKRTHEPLIATQLAGAGYHVRRRVLLTRGRLFYPAHTALLSPPQAYPDHQRGLWWRNAPEPARLIPHDLWHCPESLSDNQTPELAAAALADYVEQQHRPMMIVTEQRRIGFLVPSHWPGSRT